MQFFTLEWATGDQDDGDPVAEYSQFLSTLDKDSAVYTFATSVSLNDAIIEHAVFEQASKRLKLVLLTGDLQIGYWRTEIQYTHATIMGRRSWSRPCMSIPRKYGMMSSSPIAIGCRMAFCWCRAVYPMASARNSASSSPHSVTSSMRWRTERPPLPSLALKFGKSFVPKECAAL